MNHQFSKYAHKYGNHNIIQKIISKALVRDITNQPKRILELGCGSGQIFKHINWDFEFYKAVDSSQSMCDLHPKASNLEVLCFDFDSKDFLKNIKDEQYDLIISSSALQWSKDIDTLLFYLSRISKNIM